MKSKASSKWALLMLTSILVVSGCGNSSGNKSTASETAPASSSASSASPSPASSNSGEKITLKYLDWEGKVAHDVMAANFKKFEELHPNIKVDYQSVTDNYAQKLNALAAANDLPDAAFMQEAEVLRWAKNDKLVDLSGYFENGTFTAKLESNKFIDSEGRTVAVSAANEIIMIHYNKKLFAEAGVEVPPADKNAAWTWDQFVEAARKLTKDKKGKHPGESGFDEKNIVQYGVDIPKNDFIWMPLAMSNNGGLLSPDGSELWMDKPETIDVIQKIADLALVEHVSPNPQQAKSLPGDLATRFMSNKLAMLVSGQWELVGLSDAVNSGKLENGVGVLPIFQKPVTTNAGGAPAIFKSSKHQEEAAELVKFILDPANAQANFDSGVWMPTEQSWYTEPDLIAGWTQSKVHPPEYKQAAVDYALTSTQPYYWFKVTNYAEMSTFFNPLLDQVWLGKKSAKDVVEKDIMPQLKTIFATK